jgi:hypothetical protein
MPAGINRIAELITFSYPSDDIVGGAQPSGTVLYQNLNVRIKSEEPVMALIQQGVQTPTIYTALVFPGNITVRHNDQIHFTAPVNDWFYDKKFRVIGVQRSSNHPNLDSNQIRITLKRFEESHSNDLQ